jgi:6-phosphogluconolactonase
MTRASQILTLTPPLAFAILFSAAAARSAAPRAATGNWIMYVGTYTREPSKGIYAYRYQSSDGKLTSIGLVAETVNPSFLAIHPNQRFLYAVNEIPQYEGQASGSVSAFSIDAATGALKLLNRVSSRGGGPCHVSIDRTGKWLFVANYGGGSVAAYPVHDDGSLGEASAFFQHGGSSVNPQRQSGPHAHDVMPSPDNRVVLAVDLGLDQILTYRLDPATGGLSPGDPPFVKVAAGSGPRHLAFRPDGKFVYALSEILSKVLAFRYDANRGTLQEVQTLSSLPDGFSGSNSTAEIAVHPNAPFVYASNRGHDSIAIFRIDPAKGTLAPVTHVSTQGKTPRNFAIDPTGAHLLAANQNSDTVVDFRIDRKTGGLTPTGTVLQVPSPVCLVFAKAR